MDYLIKIHNLHEKFLVDHVGVFDALKKVPVLVLDGNSDFLRDSKYFDGLVGKICEFMSKTQQIKFESSAKAIQSGLS